MGTLKELFRTHDGAYLARFGDTMPGHQKKVLRTFTVPHWSVNAQAVGEAGNCLKYLARYVFKVAIAESRITSVDDTHVCFTYRKVYSHRVRTMRLPIFAFLHRFLQHVLPTGFMKVRHFGFLSPSFGMPFEQIKARIELAQGFHVKARLRIESRTVARLASSSPAR